MKNIKLQNQWLLEQLGLAKERQFGSSSEKMHEEFMDQLRLYNGPLVKTTLEEIIVNTF